MRDDEAVDFVDLPVHRPLLDVAVDLERHVAVRGWDAPPALFALVPTSSLASLPGADPAHSTDATEDELSAIEQDDVETDVSLEELLGHLGWPPEVVGTAVAVERVVLPPGSDVPDDDVDDVHRPDGPPQAADRAGAVAIRLVVAVLRGGEGEASTSAAGDEDRRVVRLVRRRDDDRDEAVALARDLAPGLVEALRATLEP